MLSRARPPRAIATGCAFGLVTIVTGLALGTANASADATRMRSGTGAGSVPGSGGLSVPTSGPDSYVRMGPPSSIRGIWSVPVAVGNAGNVSAYYVVGKIRVSHLNQIVCEAVGPALGLAPGEAVAAFWVRAGAGAFPAASGPGTRQREVSVTIEAEVTQSQTPRPDQNPANNRVVVTVPAPGVPQCVKAVSFRDELYPVFAHYRCINCHGRVQPNPQAGSPAYPSRRHEAISPRSCRECHNVEKWTNEGVPVFWNVFSDTMENPAFVCSRVKQNSVSRDKLYHHLTKDPRMVWAFNPDSHQLPPKGPAPGGHAAFTQKMMAWFDAGKPCSMP